jgi:hypothetical protein
VLNRVARILSPCRCLDSVTKWKCVFEHERDINTEWEGRERNRKRERERERYVDRGREENEGVCNYA